MYEWRKLSPKEREQLLRERKAKRHPWHTPPHRIGTSHFYHLTAACYEHKAIIGRSPERMAAFVQTILNTLNQAGATCYAWCVMPNHYHLEIKSQDILELLKIWAKMHGRQSYIWNGEENCRGRQVWHGVAERSIRGERHFWATMNYIHHNPVHHGYVKKWTDWPYSSAAAFLEKVGTEKATEIWGAYPILDYGKGWDDPEL